MMQPVPHTRVELSDSFWSPRIETNRTVTLPIEYEQCRKTGRIGMWRWKPGRPNPPHIFWDSDLAKWLEAAAYSLAKHPDAQLERQVDRTVDGLAGIQAADGYLNTHYLLVEPGKQWSNLRDAHELYCAGHLIEAAVAHFEATGKRKFLDLMCRAADGIGRRFGRGRGQRRGYCGHPEIELALMRLYRATGEARYAALAKYFVDERGQTPNFFDAEARERGERTGARWGNAYFQAHRPVREQADAVGHAVRALYLYSGMADVAAVRGDAALKSACRRLWRSVTERRMYVTGGVGSASLGECFTCDYDLPNESAYAETCAAIALVFFAHRMLQMEADARYADVMERALYNGVPSGVGLDGRSFFYANPLAVHPTSYAARLDVRQSDQTTPTRRAWFGCACCPPNIARLLASFGQYLYSIRDRELFVHLYVGGEATCELAGQRVRVTQSTAYPWRERVRLTVAPERPAEWTLALRIPGWCRDARVEINGQPVALDACTVKGYARLRRLWTAGDRIDATFPMPVVRLEARPEVRDDCGCVALQRGPVVYCVEEADNGPDLADLALPRGARLTARWRPDLLGGCMTLQGRATRRTTAGWTDGLYQPVGARRKSVALRAVPYCLWSNRGPGEMRVWIREG